MSQFSLTHRERRKIDRSITGGHCDEEKEEKEDLIVHTQAMRHRSIGALLGLRVILVANIVLLTVLGVLFLMSYERPVAFVLPVSPGLPLSCSSTLSVSPTLTRGRGASAVATAPARADRRS